MSLTDSQRETLGIIKQMDGGTLAQVALAKWPNWTSSPNKPTNASLAKMKLIVEQLFSKGLVRTFGDGDHTGEYEFSVFAEDAETEYDNDLYESVDLRRKVADFIAKWVLDVNGRFPVQLHRLMFRDLADAHGIEAAEKAVEMMSENDPQGRARAVINLVISTLRSRHRTRPKADESSTPESSSSANKKPVEKTSMFD